ncbi:MAG: response regulator [Candidatus Saganbacteria bacterium]|nr:response regulator [Candidatus Saganbacteria bacterium]
MAKILVVDDDAVIRKRIEEILLSEKHEVITAPDGLAGLNAARTQSPNIIVLDLLLPKLNGHQVCRMLKYDSRYKSIPIIMFTSNISEKDKELGKQAGADAYLFKKNSPHHLLGLVKDLLEAAKKAAPLKKPDLKKSS